MSARPTALGQLRSHFLFIFFSVLTSELCLYPLEHTPFLNPQANMERIHLQYSGINHRQVIHTPCTEGLQGLGRPRWLGELAASSVMK